MNRVVFPLAFGIYLAAGAYAIRRELELRRERARIKRQLSVVDDGEAR